MPPHAVFDENSISPNYSFSDTARLPTPDPPYSFKNNHKGLSWAPSKSSSLYKIEGWGAPYFFVNAKGDMAVRPHGQETKPNDEIDLMDVVERVLKPKIKGGLGLSTPAIFRFPDVLRDRLDRLQSAFDHAINAKNYQGCFQGVFPVKCNQDRFVVDNIVEFGKPYGFGLEAGSKPELLLAMASLCKGSPQALLVCNGYKDADYVCLALMARKLGLNCVIVLEQEEELDMVLKMSGQLCIEPVIGLRAKLNTKHAGHFGETSGEKGKFGLSCSDIVAIVNKLHRAKKVGCLQLLHFHIGSQIPSLSVLNDGVSEAAHIYCELARMGANMKFIDIGGGLGIDYDGTNSAHSDMSVGYTMEEYALEVVHAVKDACNMKCIKQPTLCSESGRALVSHHSVLVFDVLSSTEKNNCMAKGVSLEVDGLPGDLKSLHNSLTCYARACDYQRALECAKLIKHDCIDLFKHGQLSLTQLASINNIYDVVSASVDESSPERISSTSMPSSRSFDSVSSENDEESKERDQNHNAIYHINLSIFKSMPDTWAIGQLFPIVPLHRLEQKPKVRAILSDLTCDSDGKIATFVGNDTTKGKRLNYLKVHPLEEGKPYYMGMFLGGAYQEALGGQHNLFGSPNVVSVCKDGLNGFKVTKASDGQTAADVLRIMQHEPSSMLEGLKLQIQKSLNYDEEATMGLIHTLICSFGSSTYLSTNNANSSVFTKGSLYTKSSIMGSSLRELATYF